ncbi:MAG: hypothetical protein EHM93_08920 [Bacteroidales bacterium]|nr:MAG: hypothetical protein EHM93_08920 [Bacteroidales bacterium]
MKKITVGLFSLIALCNVLRAQDAANSQIQKITFEIDSLFIKSIKAAETVDAFNISANVNDSLKTGFVDNGIYFDSFSTLLEGFKQGIKGIDSQKLDIANKKITILSDNSALLTASGNSTLSLSDGRIINGEFSWTFVYLKIRGAWKIIHSHMSNPRE